MLFYSESKIENNKKTSVKQLLSNGKCISFPEGDQSNDDTNLPNAGKKLQDTTKTIMRRRTGYEKQIDAMSELFSEYSESSSLHGVKYVGQKERPWVERTWWAFAFIISLVICGKLILDTFTKWERFPVIVTIAEPSARIWEIPFPAVTLCPQIKIKQTVFNYTNYFILYQNDWTKAKGLNASEFSRLKSAAQICKMVPKGFLKIESLNTTNDIYSNLRSIAPQVSDIMYHCDFNGHKTKDCSRFFKEVWTEEGLCYTFNFLNGSDLYRTRNLAADYPVTKHNMSAKYWNVNSNYKKFKKVSEDKIFPHRVFGSSDGLTVNLKILKKDLDFLCGASVDGFKLLLHPPNEVPQMNKYYYRVPMKHEVIFSVKPIFMDTLDTVKLYDSKRRQCYFENERYLTFYKSYTHRNCELECISNYTINKCGCSPFYMPRNSSTSICGLSNYDCFKKNKNIVASGQHDLCGCLPSCSSLSYDVEFSLAKFRFQKIFATLNRSVEEYARYDVTRIFISFKDNQFFASRRSQLYGKTDFLANCGGLLGMFMGFSFLSLVEVVYFCTLRLACNLRRRHARKKERLAIMTESFHKEERF